MNNKKTGAGQYNKLIEVYRTTYTSDLQGGGVESSSNVISVYCSMEALSGEKAFIYGKKTSNTVWKFKTRYLRNIEIKSSDYLKHGTKEFTIKEMIWNNSEVTIIGVSKE